MKKFMLVTLTAIFAICFSAFTFKNHQSDAKPSFDPEYWYELNAGADPTNPANYFLVGGDGQSAPSCVLTTGFRCAIKTEKQGPIVNPLHPDYPDLGTFSEERKRNTP